MEYGPIDGNRHSERSSVFLSASLDSSDGNFGVRLRNLSKHGVLVESETLPAADAEVFFVRKDLRVPSKVVWVHGRYAGIAFARLLEPEEVLRHIPTPRTAVPIEARRPGLACRPLSSYERRMLERWMTSSPHGVMGE